MKKIDERIVELLTDGEKTNQELYKQLGTEGYSIFSQIRTVSVLVGNGEIEQTVNGFRLPSAS